MINRCRRFCCMNNTPNMCNSKMLEKSCSNVGNKTQDYNENCSCGFDDNNSNGVFPENPMLAQSYVPIQTMNETFKPCIGLKNGTIFPELVSPYNPGDSMKQIKYLEKTNIIGKGCNK